MPTGSQKKRSHILQNQKRDQKEYIKAQVPEGIAGGVYAQKGKLELQQGGIDHTQSAIKRKKGVGFSVRRLAPSRQNRPLNWGSSDLRLDWKRLF